jgi:SRSO17 transposase
MDTFKAFEDFGLGHFEVRGWRGFHHHAPLSIAAYGFLMAQHLKKGLSTQAEVKKTSPNAKCLSFPTISCPGEARAPSATCPTRLRRYAFC